MGKQGQNQLRSIRVHTRSKLGIWTVYPSLMQGLIVSKIRMSEYLQLDFLEAIVEFAIDFMIYTVQRLKGLGGEWLESRRERSSECQALLDVSVFNVGYMFKRQVISVDTM
jgi:hypothetical protein